MSERILNVEAARAAISEFRDYMRQMSGDFKRRDVMVSLLHAFVDAYEHGDGQAPTPEQVALHEQYVVDHAADHDDDCPEDDTCECSFKPRNDAVNAVCCYLSTGKRLAASDSEKHGAY